MLKLLFGPDMRVLRNDIIRRLQDKTEKRLPGQILIVPEQYSFDTERMLCKTCGNHVSRYCEVLSFTRLCSRVETIAGGAGKTWLDEGGRLLTMSKTVSQVRAKLKLYAGAAEHLDFLTEMLASISEFGAYGVTPEDILSAAKEKEGRFAEKLQELALLYETYLANSARMPDPVLRLQNLSELLNSSDYAEDKDFYICGFTDFTAVEMNILTALVQNSQSVTLALPEENGHFICAQKTAASLRKFCEKRNISVQTERFGFLEDVPEDLLFVQKNLNKHTQEKYCGAIHYITCEYFPSNELECGKSVSDILSLLNRGERLRSIGIACATPSVYFPILRRRLQQAGLNAHFSDKPTLRASYGAKMLLSALGAIEGFEPDYMHEYLQSGATALSDCEKDLLENYLTIWNIRGNAWLKEWTAHPLGAGEKKTEKSEELLRQLNASRLLCITPLTQLRDEMKKAANDAEKSEAVFRFTEAINLSEKIDALADTLFAQGNFEKSQEIAQSYDMILNALEQMAMTLSDCLHSNEDYTDLLEMLFSVSNVSTVPASVDEISVGSAADFRGKSVKHLFVLGASDGAFPAFSSRRDVFTDAERKSLLLSGMSLAPAAEDDIQRDLDNITLCLRSATHSLHVFCTGDRFSYTLRKIQNIIGEISFQDTARYVLNRVQFVSESVRCGLPPQNEDTALYDELLAGTQFDVGELTHDAAKNLYGTDISLSASQAETFAKCRMRYFLQYGIKAETVQESSFDRRIFGTFVHYVLEKVGKEVKERGGMKAVSEDEFRNLTEKYLDEFLDNLAAEMDETQEDTPYLFRFNRMEAEKSVYEAREELLKSDFEPFAFELSFGKDKTIPPLTIQTASAIGTFKGYVDRVDTADICENKFYRVIDYKTYNKDFSYTSLSVGDYMQMLIYLFAIKKHTKELFDIDAHPAGVLYVPLAKAYLTEKQRISAEDAKSDLQKKKLREGILLDDAPLLYAAENISEGEKPCFIPYYPPKKDGSLPELLVTHEQFSALEKFVYRKLAQIVEEIATGRIATNPLKTNKQDACAYCDYKNICNMERVKATRRNYKEIKRDEFFDALEKGEI